MILINGCSFTEGYNLTDPQDNWPNQFGTITQKQVTNLALGGASNDRIYRTTKEWLVTNPQPEHVIIGWTNFDRSELSHHQGLYIRGIPTGSQSEIEYNPDDMDIVHKHWLSYNLNGWINYRNWLYNVLFLQDYFESHSIPYTFFHAVRDPLIISFLKQRDNALELADQAWQWRDKSKYKADRKTHTEFKELVNLCRRVDLDRWLIPENGGLYDHLLYKGFKTDETNHFYGDGYAYWANLLLDKFK